MPLMNTRVKDGRLKRLVSKGDSTLFCMAFYLMYYFISSDGNLEFYRIPGVLQRFGVCYLLVAMMQLLLSPMDNKEKKVLSNHDKINK